MPTVATNPGFQSKHLLGIEGLQPFEIEDLLERADGFVGLNRQANKKLQLLKGLTQINLFFESSTRTQTSFELAGKRLGADVVNMSVASSAMKKGETLIDTAMTLNAMHPDVLVVRHQDSGAVALLARHVRCAVINAGDGAHEHPTQALLDALTIRRRKGRIEGLTVAICGDILHSRVARSNILLLLAMGARVRVVAPTTLLPASVGGFGVEVFTDMQRGLEDVDIVMMLRLQTERMQGSFVPSVAEYFHFYGLTYDKLRAARPDALIMHPGPMNRGVEIDGVVADDIDRSAILDQVEMGVAVRMAVLDVLTRHLRDEVHRMSRPVVIVNARLLDPASGLDARGGVLIVGGRIAELGAGVTMALAPGGAEVFDAKGLCLAPGLVDMRVQLGEPGAEHKERIDSGAAAAAAGGVTSMAVLPNTDPPIDEPAMVEFVARRARQVKLGKVYPYAAVTKKLRGEELAEIGLLKAAGAVAFTDGERALANARVMRRALAYAAGFDALIVQHPEEPSLAEHGVMNEGPLASRLGLAGIAPAAETIMVERDLRLLELSGGRLHFAHVSTAAAVQAIREAKTRGLRVTCDTAPHYLALNELEVEGYRTFAKVSPPLRAETDRRAVVDGIKDGTIDVIASDHCPQDQDSKRLPFAQAAYGVIGLQTMLPVSLRLVHEGEIGLLALLRTMTEAPARILGLDAGRLTRGAPADLVLFDLDAPWKIIEASLKSLSKNTAFEGRLVEGRVIRTLVDGRTIFQHEG